VLYELFTGKTAFTGKGIEELQRQRESHPSTTPATLVPDLGARVERAILRCLEPDSKLRPATALEVSASLPGGDPLGEALAAGETPSPEMVAAAGSNETMRPALAVGLLVTALVSIGIVLWLTPMIHMLGHVMLGHGPEELLVRARDTVRAMGYPAAAADSAASFGYERGYAALVAAPHRRPDRATLIRALASEPAPIYFSYEQSASPLLRESSTMGEDLAYGTAATLGLASLDLDLAGRLRRFAAMPTLPSRPAEQHAVPDWDAAFRAAGLGRNEFTPAPPADAGVGADMSAAWTGRLPVSHTPVRVEASGLNGQITQFEVRFPWSEARRRFSAPPTNQPSTLADFTNVAVEIGVAFVAWLNWKQRRADTRGALRFGVYAATIFIAFSMLNRSPLVPALGIFVLFACIYLAVEPWARRVWPHAMVVWARVLEGRFRDPLVGRDLLVVAACVTLDYALQRTIGWSMGWYLEPSVAVPARFGLTLQNLLGGQAMLATLLGPLVAGVFVGMAWFTVLLVGKIVFRRTWLAAFVFFLLFGIAVGANYVIEQDWLAITQWCFELGFLLFLTVRFGPFAASLFSTLSLLIDHSILTYDFGAWYGQSSLVATVILVAIALYGYYTALGGKPLAWLAAAEPS